MKIYATVALILIVSRVSLYFALPLFVGSDYYMGLFNLKDIIFFICIALLFISNFKKYSEAGKIIAKWLLTYCISFAVIMLYGFLPSVYVAPALAIIHWYNIIWSVICASLITYYIFNLNEIA